MYKDGNSTNIVAHDQDSVNDPKSDSSDQDKFIEYFFSAFHSGENLALIAITWFKVYV